MKPINVAGHSVFLMGAVAYRRGLPITANPYKSRQFWTAWGDGWRASKDKPNARRLDLDKAFKLRNA